MNDVQAGRGTLSSLRRVNKLLPCKCVVPPAGLDLFIVWSVNLVGVFFSFPLRPQVAWGFGTHTYSGAACSSAGTYMNGMATRSSALVASPNSLHQKVGRRSQTFSICSCHGDGSSAKVGRVPVVSPTTSTDSRCAQAAKQQAKSAALSHGLLASAYSPTDHPRPS